MILTTIRYPHTLKNNDTNNKYNNDNTNHNRHVSHVQMKWQSHFSALRSYPCPSRRCPLENVPIRMCTIKLLLNTLTKSYIQIYMNNMH